jgi:hypothetical protein
MERQSLADLQKETKIFFNRKNSRKVFSFLKTGVSISMLVNFGSQKVTGDPRGSPPPHPQVLAPGSPPVLDPLKPEFGSNLCITKAYSFFDNIAEFTRGT